MTFITFALAMHSTALGLIFIIASLGGGRTIRSKSRKLRMFTLFNCCFILRDARAGASEAVLV